jgi:hypothetical protein
MIFVLGCILLEVASNRPFYHVLLEFGNFGKGMWFQRAKLIDGAIETFGEWWLAGYYGKDPGWGRAAGMGFTDCNNEFLLKAIEYGMLGVIALGGTLVAAFQGLAGAFKKTADKGLRSLYWAMGCALVGIFVIWQGVSYFGQSVALFHCLLGMIGSSFALAEPTSETSPVQIVERGNYISAYRY